LADFERKKCDWQSANRQPVGVTKDKEARDLLWRGSVS
jgi:hypothetical protein